MTAESPVWPVVKSPQLLTKPGEIVHFELPAAHNDRNGLLAITSDRIVFLGPAGTVELPHPSVHDCQPMDGSIEITVRFHVQEPDSCATVIRHC